jgi:ornithine cyclodeaminase/alanine dehydrogenase-like protein (mu-crystallin family)
VKTLILSSADIRRAIITVGLDALMDEMIGRLSAALASFRPTDAAIPARQGFTYTQPAAGLLEWMPCMYNGGTQATIKVVGYHPTNLRLRKLPTILSTVSTYDTASGHLICMMDATFITALRTGAASAVATRHMASPRATTLGLFGAGAQAVTQFHAISRVVDLERVLIHDADPDVEESFLTRTCAFAGNIRIEPAAPKVVIESSDVVCTVTSVDVGAGPVFHGIEPQPWAHFNAVGSDFPGKTELPAELLHRCFVSPDFREQAVKEGECQQLPPEEIGPDLFELVQQTDRYRFVQDHLSVFDSTGWALEDQVAMDLFMELAADLDLGTHVSVETIPSDPLNPYHLLGSDGFVQNDSPGARSISRTSRFLMT